MLKSCELVYGECEEEGWVPNGRELFCRSMSCSRWKRAARRFSAAASSGSRACAAECLETELFLVFLLLGGWLSFLCDARGELCVL